MTKYSSKEISATFFEGIASSETSKSSNKFKCKCGVTRSQDLKKGYINLISHIKTNHPDWEEVMSSKKSFNKSQSLFINQKASTYYSWLRWIILDCHPFSFVERPLTRQYSNLENVSVDSLMKYLKLLTEVVEEKVAASLPEQFGLIIDGWTEGTTHFFGLVACFENGPLLLSISPPVDEEKYDAESQKLFVMDVLGLYSKSLDNVLFLVGDNAPVNFRLADLMSVPFIGCASHRFNLACKLFLKPYEQQLGKVSFIMGFIRGSVKQAAKLRTKTSLAPVLRNVTRWSSTFAMLKRFFEIEPFLDESEPTIAANYLTRTEIIELKKLLEDMNEFEVVTKQLQNPKCSLSEVRIFFDTVLESYPTMKKYLSEDSQIIHCPAFEKGIVKIQEGNCEDLSNSETEGMKIFRAEVDDITSEEENQRLTLTEKVIKNKRRKISRNKNRFYKSLDFIPSTSNIVERLFSTAKLVLTDSRKSMTPFTFDCVIFLKFNEALWDINTVAKLMEK